jgi:hypothetical protein
MNLLNLPNELLCNIAEYLDIPDILRLYMVNRHGHSVFRWNLNRKLKEYVLRCNIKIGDNCDCDLSLMIYILFFLKRSIQVTTDSNTIRCEGGIINITIIKTKYSYFAIQRHDKCVFFVKNCNDFNEHIDKLEMCLLDCKIYDKKIIKSSNGYNIQNNNNTIKLYRTNYGGIGENNLEDFMENLTMVTFHVFI